ncbi:MAG: hypothetical protein JRK53_08955 [Deltaproteobacteria bacterium]|nr:hypothetical protein [Deltaproteobacteria bacterium]
MEEYLTVDELGARIKFSKQSLYNMIHNKTFILGEHYLKPTPKKILFKWSEIQLWMGESFGSDNKPTTRILEQTNMTRNAANSVRNTNSSAIRI